MLDKNNFNQKEFKMIFTATKRQSKQVWDKEKIA